ncbi:Gx transporter family protein [Paenibacillus aquistagni]|uniref:Heptaprenyl diphosphate synthase n=1 Tax=Paenibacillus aquistagni TaxID=1852522 RepID=A0A1X7KS92_9BACL|nr:Gx transporter family protein [Paenibacillus aquistagni]NMM52499.1 Gx transporter family protein [Paenibacillus aquistagni]SMG44446.1 heptaprenyl diphosphate synthase [Paenibacillus aquistagni]
MPSSDNLTDSSLRLKKTVIIAIFSAVAVVLGIIESFIPLPFAVPGAKLGLANVMVLTCLYFLRGRDAFALIILKTVITSLILGTFSAFLFSFLGAVFSFVVMYGLMKIGRGRISLIGISVVGGVAHNAGQLTAAVMVFKTSKIFYYLPPLMLLGVVTGVFIGIAVKYVVQALSKQSLFEPFVPETY